MVTFAVNVIGDLILIPIFKNEGAAIAFLLSCLVQTILFTLKNKISELNSSLFTLLKCIFCALGSYFLAKALFQNPWLAIFMSCLFFFAGLLLTMQIKPDDHKNIRKILSS